MLFRSHLWLQSFNRPELSVRGLVFAYNTELARKVGIRTDIIRGEDGSLALGLKPYGRIAFVRKRRARAVTGYGTVSKDGSLMDSCLLYTSVVALVMPFVLISNALVALGVMLAAALVIIALFNYYYAVARAESFRRRFTEMAVLSFTVAGISFLIGYLLKALTGIEA